MAPLIIQISILRNSAMALFPFILFKDETSKKDMVLLNHEKIHLRQQVELLIIPFYIIYLFNYILNLLKYRNHFKAYLNVVFEKEAYHYDKNLQYLNYRKAFSFMKFFYTR